MVGHQTGDKKAQPTICSPFRPRCIIVFGSHICFPFSTQMSRVSYQEGPTHHDYAWPIGGPFDRIPSIECLSIIRMHVICSYLRSAASAVIPVRSSWIFMRVPLNFDGAPENIQGNVPRANRAQYTISYIYFLRIPRFVDWLSLHWELVHYFKYFRFMGHISNSMKDHWVAMESSEYLLIFGLLPNHPGTVLQWFGSKVRLYCQLSYGHWNL